VASFPGCRTRSQMMSMSGALSYMLSGMYGMYALQESVR
jgi:hypothetical protein